MSNDADGADDGGAAPEDTQVELPATDGGAVHVELSGEAAEHVDADALESRYGPSVDVHANTNAGQSDVIPASTVADANLGSSVADNLKYNRIDNDQIQKLRDKRIRYDDVVAEWLLKNDDLVPSIRERFAGLILGENGLAVEPADADDDGDKRLAEHMTEVYREEVKPHRVVRRGLDDNFAHAMHVARSTDLAELDLEHLDLYTDGATGERVFVQDAMEYPVVELGEDPDGDGSVEEPDGVDIYTEESEEQALIEGEDVFTVELFENPPLEAVATDIVHKLQLKIFKARKAEVASVGGVFIRVKVPEWLEEDQYDARPDGWTEENDVPDTRLEQEVQVGLDDAMDTLQSYQSATVMSIPPNWEVDTIELPEQGEPFDDLIRGYNKDIARRFLFSLDLIELEQGSELSRDTLFKTLLNTVAGWRRQFISLFDNFADLVADIHGVDGSVEHSFSSLEEGNAESLIQLLQSAGVLGLSQEEARTIANQITGVNLDATKDAMDSDREMAPGGPGDPEEREGSMESFLEETGPAGPADDGGDDDGTDDDGAASTPAAAVDWDPNLHPRGPDGRFMDTGVSISDLTDLPDFDNPKWTDPVNLEEGSIVQLQDHRESFGEKKAGIVRDVGATRKTVQVEDGDMVEVEDFGRNDVEIAGKFDPNAEEDDGPDGGSILSDMEDEFSDLAPDDDGGDGGQREEMGEEERLQIMEENMAELPAVPEPPARGSAEERVDLSTDDMEGGAPESVKDAAVARLESGQLLGMAANMEEVTDDSDLGPFRRETTIPFYDSPNDDRATVDVLVDTEDYANLQAEIHKRYRDTSRVEHFGAAEPDQVEDLAEFMESGPEGADRVPMPHVIIGENGRVQGTQEGRHRALAALEADVDQIPVRFVAERGKDKEPRFPPEESDAAGMGGVAAASFKEGEKVEVDGTRGVVTEKRTAEFTGPDGTDYEPTESDPVYVVATEDGAVVATEEELEASDWSTGTDDPTEELANEAEAMVAAVTAALPDGHDPVTHGTLHAGPTDWDYPQSWQDADVPARLILLDAWSSMGGQFDCGGGCCHGTMVQNGMSDRAANQFCASMKDRVLMWEGWRGTAVEAGVSAAYTFMEGANLREAAHHVRRVVERRAGDDETVEVRRKDGGMFSVLVRDRAGDFVASVLVKESVGGDGWVVVGNDDLFSRLESPALAFSTDDDAETEG